MTNLKRKLLAVAIGCFVSVGAFAQRREEDKRPPKQPDNKVVVQPKGDKPPQNSNQGDKKNDGRRGKP